jgi:hypothetical protein
VRCGYYLETSSPEDIASAEEETSFAVCPALCSATSADFVCAASASERGRVDQKNVLVVQKYSVCRPLADGHVNGRSSTPLSDMIMQTICKKTKFVRLSCAMYVLKTKKWGAYRDLENLSSC